MLDKLSVAEHGLGFFDLANALGIDTGQLGPGAVDAGLAGGDHQRQLRNRPPRHPEQFLDGECGRGFRPRRLSPLGTIAPQRGGMAPIVPPPGDPTIEPALALYPFLLGCQFNPVSSATVETINGQNAQTSPHVDHLRRIGFANDYRGFSLWRR